MQKQGTEGRDHPPLSTRFWIPSEILGDSEITLGRTDFCTIFCLSISKIWAIFTKIIFRPFSVFHRSSSVPSVLISPSALRWITFRFLCGLRSTNWTLECFKTNKSTERLFRNTVLHDTVQQLLKLWTFSAKNCINDFMVGKSFTGTVAIYNFVSLETVWIKIRTYFSHSVRIRNRQRIKFIFGCW